ncbi:MAG TPA: asparagine synthase-related protein [Burkholderiales bacterium]|nr:asparagine synthase-related protein [Burkholderiales bacterium]
MSAIAGIVGRVGDPVLRDALARMSAALAHRGRDGEASWIGRPDADGFGALLAHRRMAAVDAPVQPLVGAEQVLVCDGTALADGDETALLAGLERAPDEALAKLQGTFALALWNERARTLLLARDPLGHKPLYVLLPPTGREAWSLAFASELRALLASRLAGTPRLDAAGVASFVWNGFVMAPRTMVQGISSLQPGELRAFDARARPTAERHFWSMPRPAPQDDDDRRVRDSLHDSVRRSLRCSGSAAVLLSGGIDSSSIANLARLQLAEGAAPLRTFCLAMEDAQLNEGDDARAIAQALGTRHEEVVLTERAFLSSLEDALASLDQPSFDGLNQYHICRALREAGIDVALGGIGGDAIFGGDKTLRQLPRLELAATLSGWIPAAARIGAARAIANLVQPPPPRGALGSQQKWAKLPDVVAANGDVLALYQLTYALFLPRFQEELLVEPRATTWGLPAQTLARLRGEIDGHPAIEAAAILETRCFVGERLLRDADSVSAAVSVDLRSPISDPGVVEALSGVRARAKFLPVGRKPLLRKYGLEGVDPRVYEREKKGFVLPFDRWIGSGLGELMDRTLSDRSACLGAGLRPEAVARLWNAFRDGVPGLYWTRAWGIYVLLRWCERHGVRA